MIERQLDIATKDGAMGAFIVHPDRDGPHPVIIFFMDAPGIREELRDMARRLATGGYYVMLPNMYYRQETAEIWPIPMDPDAPERRRMFELMESLDIPLVMEDADALLGFAARDPAADAARVGSVGYCMSGRYAINLACCHPATVKAAASIYGVRLVTERDDSPHRAGSRTGAQLYFACAETDHWMPLEQIPDLEAGLKDDGADAEVEIYPGTNHGFAFPQRPVYDKAAAERHWERLNSLFRRNLG